MKFNTKIRYGLRVMIELAIEKDDTGILQKEIAEKQGISLKYLDHIIAPLKVAGLIKNARGKKSGYVLTKDPSKIKPVEVFKAFDPEILSMDCIGEKHDCDRTTICAAQAFWKKMNSTIEDYLKSLTLAELADREIRLRKKAAKKNMYHI
ncbi:MAG: Rrf2 family transcriptional regulator [bacterium]|nr:Rrf2 family transcriptional regulator [bacterium]